LIECLVMYRRQAQAITGIEPILPVLTPGNDVTCYQKRWFGQARHTASSTITTEYNSPKETLLDSLLYDGRFAFANKGLRQVVFCNEVCGVDITVLLTKRLTLESETFPIRMKLIPDFMVLFGCGGQASSTCASDGGIKARKIQHLHRNRRRTSTDQRSQSDNIWIATMHFAKRNLAV